MKVSYFPGCTLKNKAKDLDMYAYKSAEVLGVTLEEIETGSAAAVYLLPPTMRLPQSFLLSVHLNMHWTRVSLW